MQVYRRIVQQQLIMAAGQALPVNVAGLAKGIYTVKAVSSGGVTTQKLLLQ